MMPELLDDNKQLTASVREVHGLCDEHGDIATASLLEIWIDEAERRTWFLFETTNRVEPQSRAMKRWLRTLLSRCGWSNDEDLACSA